MRLKLKIQKCSTPGVTLIELLCVICILAILVSLNLGAISHVIRHVRKFLAE